MSLFGENLQYYRKRDGLTQEQLAERLEVSRQTVSKWEAGTSYAEMEKILQLCDIFSCDMDTLLRRDAEEEAAGKEIKDNKEHREQMQSFRTGITAGVVLLVAGCALRELIVGLGMNEDIGNVSFWILLTVAILIFIVKGMQNEHYKEKHPSICDFYTEEEKEAFERKFPARIATGVGILLIGMLIFGMFGEQLPLRGAMTEDFYYGLFMACAAVASGILVYSGLQKGEYDIEAYNRENSPARKEADEKAAIWYGCIMIVATIVFFVAGFVFGLWRVCWVAFPIGGMCCGIVSLVTQRKGED